MKLWFEFSKGPPLGNYKWGALRGILSAVLDKNPLFYKDFSFHTLKKSESSVGSGSFVGSLGSRANARLSAKQAHANGVRCAYKRYQQTRNLTFPKSDLTKLKEVGL